MVSINKLLRLPHKLGIALLLIVFSIQSHAQKDAAYIGLGAGPLVYFGDVSNQNEGYSPSIGNFGYHLTLSNPLTEYLNGGLEAMFGTLGANERTSIRNLNFRSEVRSGGLFVEYNFNHFLKEDRFISPIVSLGFSGMEFLTKSDLKDAEGNFYYYWDDGTIRNIDQNDPNAGQAVLLTRDYVYESDVRELNLDGFGDYSEKAFAMPIGIGAQFVLGQYLTANIHTRMYLTNSDLLDNVNSESVGYREGDKANDKFLYTGFVIRYGLHKKKDIPDSDILDQQLLANISDRSDEDKDGVLDIVDKCPHTPEDVQVDVSGCPIDTDKDGVADYIDLEMTSAEGAYVDKDGVTLSDEDLEKKLKRFLGSNGTNIVEGTVESASIPKPVFTPRPGKKFMVQVGETEEGISQELAALLLSIPDVQTITKGDTVVYAVGDYDNLPDAVRRQLILSNIGIEGTVISSDEGVISSESEEAQAIQDQLIAEGYSGSSVIDENSVYWRVQVGAFQYKLSYNVFAAIPDIVTIYGEDKLTRYFAGVYDNREDAEVYRNILHNSGFNDAFIAAFKGGEKIDVPTALSPDNDASSEELWTRPSPDGFDESVIRYKIILAESDGTIETKKLEQFREIGSIEQISSTERTVYMTGNFESLESAQEQLLDLHNSGLQEAEVIGLFNGEILSLDEIDQMKKN